MDIPWNSLLLRCSRQPNKGHLLPVEILSEKFLLVMYTPYYGGFANRRQLMLVCRRWHDVMVSTPGIPSELRIRKSTMMA